MTTIMNDLPGRMISGPTISAPLVSTQWLADYLGADRLVILDATVFFPAPSAASTSTSTSTSTVASTGTGTGTGVSTMVGVPVSGQRAFTAAHIPTALFADLIGDFSPAGAEFTRPLSAQFEAAVGALGIDNATTVVVYDAVAGQFAAHLWWLFRAFGYDSVAVLDGGLSKWIAEERDTDSGRTACTVAEFVSEERPRLWADSAEVQGILASEGTVIRGQNVPIGNLVDQRTNEFLGTDALELAFASVLRDARVITFNDGSVAAASDALALTLLGKKDVAVYDGVPAIRSERR